MLTVHTHTIRNARMINRLKDIELREILIIDYEYYNVDYTFQACDSK